MRRSAIGPKAMFAELPLNLRIGLRRLYIAVALPWVAWFGYHVALYGNQSSYSASARQHLSTSVLLLLLVPLGAPVILKVIIWIVQGFVPPNVEKTSKTQNQSRTQGSSIRSDIDQLRIRVTEDLSHRPDFLANKYLRTGWLFGKHFSEWSRLDEAKLSAEQKAKLPPSYYEKGGVDPTELGRLFAYPSGDAMIESLIKLQEDIRASGGLESLVDELVDEYIIRKLKTKVRRTA
jgi:hypothetical protein